MLRFRRCVVVLDDKIRRGTLRSEVLGICKGIAMLTPRRMCGAGIGTEKAQSV